MNHEEWRQPCDASVYRISQQHEIILKIGGGGGGGDGNECELLVVVTGGSKAIGRSGRAMNP